MSKIRKYYNNLSPEVKSQIKNVVRTNYECGWAAINGFASVANILYPCDNIMSIWGRHLKEDRWASYIYYYVSSILFYEDFGYSINKYIKGVYNV